MLTRRRHYRAMNRTLKTAFVLTLATLVAIGGAAAPATAASVSETPPATLDGIQRAGDAAIDRRLDALAKATAKAEASSRLTDAHADTVLATFAADTAGLTALRATLDADTDRATAAAHYTQIFTDYRVYAVALRQAAYAAAADGLSANALPKLQSSHDELAAALAASGKSTPELEATLADMQEQIDAATSALDGVAASALGTTPADFNANHDTLADERADIATARDAIKQARADGQAVLKALR